MSGHATPSTQTREFSLSSFENTRGRKGSQSSDTSSTTTTPTQTPSQELSASILESSITPSDQIRGRPKYKRHQPSRRYFTPPSRIPSPARPDFLLEVESAPQDPDIFADAETDYFSSTDKTDGPRAYRRHFFDAMPSIDSQTSTASAPATSIDAQLTSK